MIFILNCFDDTSWKLSDICRSEDHQRFILILRHSETCFQYIYLSHLCFFSFKIRPVNWIRIDLCSWRRSLFNHRLNIYDFGSEKRKSFHTFIQFYKNSLFYCTIVGNFESIVQVETVPDLECVKHRNIHRTICLLLVMNLLKLLVLWIIIFLLIKWKTILNYLLIMVNKFLIFNKTVEKLRVHF